MNIIFSILLDDFYDVNFQTMAFQFGTIKRMNNRFQNAALFSSGFTYPVSDVYLAAQSTHRLDSGVEAFFTGGVQRSLI